MFRLGFKVICMTAFMPLAAQAGPLTSLETAELMPLSVAAPILSEISGKGDDAGSDIDTDINNDILSGDFGLGLELVSEDDLGTNRGGVGIETGDVQINDATTTSSISDSSVSNTSTGAIGNVSLTDVTGDSTVMVNTGNFSTMQSVKQYNITVNQ